MKILWLSHVVPYPPKGGVFQRSYNLIREAGRENSVHLVSLNQAKLLKNQGEIDEAVSVLKESCERVDVFPIPSDRSKLHWATMTTLSYFNCAPYDVNWLKNVEMAAYLKKLAVKGRFDVVHVDTCGLFPYAEYFRDVPLVLTHHNIESHMMSRRHDMETNLLKKTYFRREAGKIRDYEREICRKCDMNLVVSDLDAARLRESVGGDVSVTVIPNGVDVDYFRPADYDFKRQEGLIFAGGLNVYTNREAMLFFVREVWPLLVKENPARRITIIGKNPPRELLNAGNESNLVATGFVDDVRPYFDAAKIYVCPITNGGGTRLKILDALAMAKPLVATAFAVEGLNLVEGEHYLRAETPLEFVKQINRLEKDDALCRRIALGGRRLVEERYSWKIIGEKLRATYSEATYRRKSN